MTTFEMQQLFETLLQTSSPLYNDMEKPDTDTIFRYLNEAQVKYIKDKYLSLPSFYERTRVIGNNLNDLKNLIQIIDLDDVTTPAPYYVNSLIYKSDAISVWHYLGVVGSITRAYPYTTTASQIDLIQIEEAAVGKYLTTSINKPIILVPVYTQTHSQVADTLDNQLTLLVIYDSYTTYLPTGTKASCLIEPKKLVLSIVDASTEITTCQLADYLHEEIVRLAVDLFEQQKYKLSQKEAK